MFSYQMITTFSSPKRKRKRKTGDGMNWLLPPFSLCQRFGVWGGKDCAGNEITYFLQHQEICEQKKEKCEDGILMDKVTLRVIIQMLLPLFVQFIPVKICNMDFVNNLVTELLDIKV